MFTRNNKYNLSVYKFKLNNTKQEDLSSAGNRHSWKDPNNVFQNIKCIRVVYMVNLENLERRETRTNQLTALGSQ